VRNRVVLRIFTAIALAAASTTMAAAQSPPPPSTEVTISGANAEPADSPQSAEPGTRQAEIERQQAEKDRSLHPYVPSKPERIFAGLDTIFLGGTVRWHPFFDSAYAGGGFTLGVGHVIYVSPYNYIDVRGSYSIANYKRLEAEFVAPRLFNRRGHLSAIGGWREATQVGFYGVGTNSSKADRTNYLFRQPYGNALLTIFPTRRVFMLGGGVEFSRWSQESGKGSFPSVETKYTPATLPGLGAEVTYLHTQGTVAIDWRTSPGYSRRGGFYGVTLHDYHDKDDAFGFQTLEYEAIQHIPILREAWVLSLHARVENSDAREGQQTPFFMLPALGGGSTLRGYSSWRFRDRNSLLLQAEWRIMVNRYLDMAFFYYAGKVTARKEDIDLDGLKDDYGFGLRFHSPFSTPLRLELARSNEGMRYIFSSGAAF
jgi:Omp85 superfamily domain